MPNRKAGKSQYSLTQFFFNRQIPQAINWPLFGADILPGLQIMTFWSSGRITFRGMPRRRPGIPSTIPPFWRNVPLTHNMSLNLARNVGVFSVMSGLRAYLMAEKFLFAGRGVPSG